MTTVSLKLPEELLARLDALAARRGVSRSLVMREALEGLVGQAAVEGSAASLAAELVGALEGPVDLASDPRHLEGFGE